jgi:hypothetical protein
VDSKRGVDHDPAGAIVPPPPINNAEELRLFQQEYMPIKYGSPLTGKLTKKYWEKAHVIGKPLLFAIEDFSAPMSMTYTRSALQIYLYGYIHDWKHEDGRLVITPRKISTHCWGTKQIPSGFFNLPGSENISAVIASNSGTISKFNRMGYLAGFGSSNIHMVRHGTAFSHDPDAAEPLRFSHKVNDPAYNETWAEGLDVFHNPRALHPIPYEAIPAAAHHSLSPDGQVVSAIPEWHPLGSQTIVTVRG